MRLLGFLNEDNASDMELISKFHSDTTQWWKEMGGVRLWRATKKKPTAIQKFMPRMDRKPLDTPKEIHDMVDMQFFKEFKWKPRSQGVFAGSSPTFAEFFGPNAYLFYPANGYKYVWSKYIEDLTGELEEAGYIYEKGTHDWKTTDEWDEFSKAEKELRMKKIVNGYTDRKLPDIGYKSSEVMFYCPNGYYLIENKFFSKYSIEITEDAPK